MTGMSGQQDRSKFAPGTEEPLFNVKPAGMEPKLLEQCLIVLAGQNTESLKKVLLKQGHFKSGMYAEFLFNTCDKLRLGPEARFLSLELLDRFMLQHITDLYSHVLSQDNDNDKVVEWESIVERVRSQIPLRVVSCCQIASKLTSHYWIVGPRRVQVTVQEFGYQYSLSSILQSELRILKTLNYKVMIPTPLIYVETILEILGHNDPSTESKAYHNICLNVLEVIYMRRDFVYEELYKMVTSNSTPSDENRKEFMAVRNDHMLLAVAVISVASYLVDQRRTDRVIDGLSRITLIPSENILDFATVIMQIIVGNSKI